MKESFYVWTILPLTPVLLVAFYYVFLRQFYMGHKSKKWSLTKAKVIAKSLGIHSYRRINKYYPIVTYKYNLQGNEYTGNNFSFCKEYYISEAEAQNRIAAFEVGDDIDVFINTQNPKQSVINAGYDKVGLWMVVTAFALIPLALIGAAVTQ